MPAISPGAFTALPLNTANVDKTTFQQWMLAVEAVATAAREKLTANRTYYVRGDGNNGNDGLTNSAGGALLTLAAAWAKYLALDCNGFQVTIQAGNFTFSAGLATALFNPTGTVQILGDITTPANCVISAIGAFQFFAPGTVTVRGFKHTGTGVTIYARDGATVNHGNIEFAGTNLTAHVWVDRGGTVVRTQSCTIAAGGASHVRTQDGGIWQDIQITDTLANTPAFSIGFAYCLGVGVQTWYLPVFNGTGATGPRFSVASNGNINTYGQATTFLPGSTAGTEATGGRYT